MGDAPTVQAGIDSAATGDTVLVAPGTYVENLHFRGQDIVLQSQFGPEVTVLDGSANATSVILLEQGETRGTVIEGFTITGGTGGHVPAWTLGGGISTGDASPTIRKNVFVQNSAQEGGAITTGWVRGYQATPHPLLEGNTFGDNYASLNGGAIRVLDTSILIRRNVFEGNSAWADGGAIAVRAGTGESIQILESEFSANTCGDHGGGAYIFNSGFLLDLVLRGNVFFNNQADGAHVDDTGSGGGGWLSDVSGIVENNTMAKNIGLGESECSGGGLTIDRDSEDLIVRNNIIAFNSGGGISCYAVPATSVHNNIIWENSEDVQCDVKCPSWDFLEVDPLFCDLGSGDLSVAENSPALTGEEVIGAIPTPGCTGTPVTRTTWGQIKAHYH